MASASASEARAQGSDPGGVAADAAPAERGVEFGAEREADLGAAIEAALAGLTRPAEIRAAAVAGLRAHLDAGREAIAARLAEAPRRARPVVAATSALTDEVVRAAHRVAIERLHPNPTPSGAERLALLAVGGYGRAEMAPCSDVDLLFVTPWKMTGWAESVIESTLYMLWDLHLKVGTPRARSATACGSRART